MPDPNNLGISSPDDIQAYYLANGVAPGVQLDSGQAANPDTTDPGRAADWLARNWWTWRLQKAAEDDNRLVNDPMGVAQDLAMSFMPMGMGMAGTLGGRLAAKADLGALRMATAMEKGGYAPEQIWKDTGWFKDKDLNWKFEIPDEGARLDPNARVYPAATPSSHPTSWLPEAMPHPELYDQYPELRDMGFTSDPNALGRFMGRQWKGSGIGINIPLHNTAHEALGTGVHELQHMIQDIEGFAHGTTPEGAANALSDVGLPTSIHDPGGNTLELGPSAYNQTAGEIEARNVTGRLGNRAGIPTSTAENFPNQMFLHEGHIYVPIEHDPFVGLEEARKALGRQDSPRQIIETRKGQGASLLPVEHDPFGGAGAIRPVPPEPPLTNPTETQLAKEHQRGVSTMLGQSPGVPHAAEFKGVFDGKDVHMLSGYDSTHADVAGILGKKSNEADTFTVGQNPDGTYWLEVYPKNPSHQGFTAQQSGPLWDAIAKQPTIKRLLERKPNAQEAQ